MQNGCRAKPLFTSASREDERGATKEQIQQVVRTRLEPEIP